MAQKQKELKNMRRSELIDIIYELETRGEQLAAEKAALEEKLKQREIILAQAGSIAEAALRLNKVFEDAQAAANDYLLSVQAAVRRGGVSVQDIPAPVLPQQPQSEQTGDHAADIARAVAFSIENGEENSETEQAEPSEAADASARAEIPGAEPAQIAAPESETPQPVADETPEADSPAGTIIFDNLGDCTPSAIDAAPLPVSEPAEAEAAVQTEAPAEPEQSEQPESAPPEASGEPETPDAPAAEQPESTRPQEADAASGDDAAFAAAMALADELSKSSPVSANAATLAHAEALANELWNSKAPREDSAEAIAAEPVLAQPQQPAETPAPAPEKPKPTHSVFSGHTGSIHMPRRSESDEPARPESGELSAMLGFGQGSDS